MVAVDDQYGRFVGWSNQSTLEQSTLEQSAASKSTESIPSTRREWVAPTWQRWETPMEITMYAGRR